MADIVGDFFSDDFVDESQVVNNLTIRLTRSRSLEKPPLLLLHGYPQSRIMWRLLAPVLAADFSVIMPDLRGYGESDKPEGDKVHTTYSKRAMASDMAAVMAAYGFDRFHAAGHDRGGRVLHCLCLDYPERVLRVSFLDIVPTCWTFDHVNSALATAYYHWFFLQQPYPFPETMIAANPEHFLIQCLSRWSAGNMDAFSGGALQAYVRAFNNPAMIHATCEDYRAAASSDYVLDKSRENLKIASPVQCLWGGRGFVGRTYPVLDIWSQYAVDVTGQALDCGHFPAEELPDESALLLKSFFLS